MRAAARSATAVSAILAFCLFAVGCNSNGGNLSGFWTITAQDGRQVTLIKLEKRIPAIA